MALGRTLLNLIYPTVCAACGRACNKTICEDCLSAMPLRAEKSFCSICGKTLMEYEFSYGTATPICTLCRAHSPKFDLARAAAYYKTPLREIIHRLKFRGAIYLAPTLSELMHAAVLAYYPNERFDSVIPVPIHRLRRFSRGYNQAEELARQLAKRLALPLDIHSLVRCKYSSSQVKNTVKERRENVRNVFAVHSSRTPYIYGRTILLVDDVMTTGSTFEDCSRALKAAGASRVIALSLARD